MSLFYVFKLLLVNVKLKVDKLRHLEKFVLNGECDCEPNGTDIQYTIPSSVMDRDTIPILEICHREKGSINY